jgi:hypothetical protein
MGQYFRKSDLETHSVRRSTELPCTFVRWSYFFTHPPLTFTETELRDGFDIIDRALTITDKAVTSS